MATYKEIKGVTVQTKDEDPVQNAGTWASGGDLNTGRSGSGAGKQTANLIFGGDTPSRTNICESYDGTSWTEVGDMNTSRSTHGGMGTYTAALAAGGRVSPSASTAVSEEWNGSSWTEGNDLNQNRYAINNRGAGTQTAGLCVGGNRRLTPQGTTSPNLAPQNFFSGTEEYDGTSWTEVNDAPLGGESGGGIGTQTAAGMWGIYNGSLPSPSTRANGYLYDGTNWTTSTDFPIEGGAYSESGTTTDGLAFGIYNNSTSPTVASNTVAWNGTVWTEVNDISTGRYGAGGGKAGADPSEVAILAGGYNGSTNVANTEEWSFPPVTQAKLKEGMIFLSGGTTLKGFGTAAGIPTATWSSGGAVNTARSRFGGATNATQTAGLIFGAGSSPYGQTEEYNGTAWSEQNDLNTGRYISYGGGGTQTACITAGGYNPAGSPVYATVVAEQYNGTSWTEVNDLNEGRLDCATFGTSTSAILVGGGEGPGSPGTVSSVESWDGTSWTETTNIPATRQEMGAWGSTSTAGAIVGGTQDTSPTITAETLEWNGSAWTAGGDYPSVLKYTSVFGSLNSAIVAGGENATAIIGICAHYNGTSWTEVAEMTTARMGCSGNGSAVSGFAASGGTSPGAQTNTEEFTADLTLADITVS